jgi:ribonuclease HII
MSKKRTSPSYSIESELISKGYKFVAGVDESGRGPGAGPVVAAAVRIPPARVNELIELGANDSKKLSEKRREALYEEIINTCDYGIGTINNDIIDEINVLEATKLAMIKSINDLDMCNFAIIDGTVVLKIPIEQEQVIKGDAKSISVACASIIAKVTRDRIMYDLHEKFPIYGWNTNKGYLTKKHIEAIRKYGITEWHRLSFRKVGG